MVKKKDKPSSDDFSIFFKIADVKQDMVKLKEKRAAAQRIGVNAQQERKQGIKKK